MEKAASKLKELRKAAMPRITVRAMAEAVGMPLGSYARYESVSDYKKAFLPLEFTRKVAAILMEHGIDPAEVMKLAGLTEQEAEPEGKLIEASLPPIQYVPVAMAMPSEAMLKDMFRGLLLLVPDGASKDEIASILARRLPTGFAAIGPYWLDQAKSDVVSPDAEQSPVEDRSAEGQPLRT